MTQEFVTLPREVVERALDAFIRGCPPDCKDGMTDSGGVHPWGDSALIQCPSCQAAEVLRAALEQPQNEQEPVAWIENVEGGIGYNPYHEAARKLPDGVRFDLYVHPQPKREPLTAEQWTQKLGDRQLFTILEAIRFVEKEYGIEDSHNIK